MTATANQAVRGVPNAADPVQVIADSPLLRSIDRSSLDGLSPELEWIDLDEQEVLSLDGNRGDALYFVASGRLEITHASGEQDAAVGGDAQVLAVIIAGDVISEMRALTGSEDLAMVRGVTACTPPTPVSPIGPGVAFGKRTKSFPLALPPPLRIRRKWRRRSAARKSPDTSNSGRLWSCFIHQTRSDLGAPYAG